MAASSSFAFINQKGINHFIELNKNSRESVFEKAKLEQPQKRQSKRVCLTLPPSSWAAMLVAGALAAESPPTFVQLPASPERGYVFSPRSPRPLSEPEGKDEEGEGERERESEVNQFSDHKSKRPAVSLKVKYP